MRQVVIVGAGALGSHLAIWLRNLDVSLKLIDYDRVESKNVASQFHTKPSVGKLKVEALKQSVQFLFGQQVVAVPHRLVDANADVLLAGADLVADCLDNGESRAIVQRIVRARNIPCLHGAMNNDGTYGRVVWDQQFTIDYGPEGAATCENGQFLPFIACVTAYLGLAAQQYLDTGSRWNFSISPSGVVRF